MCVLNREQNNNLTATFLFEKEQDEVNAYLLESLLSINGMYHLLTVIIRNI